MNRKSHPRHGAPPGRTSGAGSGAPRCSLPRAGPAASAAAPCGKRRSAGAGPRRGCARSPSRGEALRSASAPRPADRRGGPDAAPLRLRSQRPGPAACAQRPRAASPAHGAGTRVHRRSLPRGGSLVRRTRARRGRRGGLLPALRTAHCAARAPAQPRTRSDARLPAAPQRVCGCTDGPFRGVALLSACARSPEGRPGRFVPAAAAARARALSGGSGCRVFAEAPPPQLGRRPWPPAESWAPWPLRTVAIPLAMSIVG